MTTRAVYLRALGRATGSRLLDNTELSALTGTAPEAILRLTGIRTRAYAPFEDEVDLAVRAAEDLLRRLDRPKKPDFLLAATTTPKSFIPSTAARVSSRLYPDGGPPVLDVGGSCAAFMTGLFTARSLIASGAAQDILLLNTERKTGHVCPVHTPDTALLFGDGASAAWISDDPGPERGSWRLREIRIGADGSLAPLIAYVPDPETGRKILSMDGPALFRKAVRTLSREIGRLLRERDLPPGEAGAFILHQANGRILDGIAARLEIPEERIPRTVSVYGNTSSASLGITLGEFLDNGPAPPSRPLVLGAIGGGLTWGVGLLDPV